MAGVRDGELAKPGPWPLGVNNVARAHELPLDENGNPTSLRQAVNVDLDNAGWPRLRAGTVQRAAYGRAHSLFGGAHALLGIADGDLVAFDESANATTVLAGVGDRYASFAEGVDDVLWSNGLQIGRITPDLLAGPVWIDTPLSPGATAVGSGGLAAGEYAVSITAFDASGRESGASPPVAVVVAANGGILLALPALPAGATRGRVYCSAANGGLDEGETALYAAIEFPPGQTSLLLGAFEPGRACETQWLRPLPPGQFVRRWNGRTFIAAVNLLCWSEPLRDGLMHHDSTLRFGADITLMEPVGEGGDGSGIFLADHARAYFLSGGKPAEWQRVVRYSHPAVRGTSVIAPGTAFGLETSAPVACWLATNGAFCLGLPGGQVQPMTEGRLALAPGDHGAMAFREVNGLRQLITTFLSGGVNSLAASDRAVATVRRNGVVID